MIIFESERLYVQRYTVADVDHFFMLNGDPELMRYIRAPKTKSESKIFFEENMRLYEQMPGIGRFAVFLKEGNQFAGSFSLLSLEDSGDFHLGYMLLQKNHGKGLATELVKASLNYVYKTLQNNIVKAITVRDNIASQKVLLKSGFILTGTTEHEGEEVLVFERQQP